MTDKSKAESEGIYIQDLQYHAENEGVAKTFRDIRTDHWYYESEIVAVIGILNIDKLKK
jgi:hypothetical protein